jgi:hypothetical protein
MPRRLIATYAMLGRCQAHPQPSPPPSTDIPEEEDDFYFEEDDDLYLEEDDSERNLELAALNEHVVQS